ncbi:amidohydrolase family protein [Flexivirga meconopsidis]|uniref:amidohydrolase family protein n=1 Tax=Flexivirga meconopsidis TaxID=2977121 RepID=UPI00223EA186|nr:amidohydrolase family protein [Flexivirga meconopsidis]
MGKLDVHAHAVVACTGARAERMTHELIVKEGFAGRVPGAGWSVEGALQFMDAHDIALQLLSIPGALSPSEAHDWNGQAAEIVAKRPDRFGLLAALPLADTDSALAEVVQADEELAADGFAIASNYDGCYLGDPRFEPVFAELERRGLPVFVHPTLPPAFDMVGLGRPGPLFEYPVDTARTALDAIFSGLFLRHPGLAMILAHAGGVLPALSDRITMLGVQSWVANPHKLTATQLREQLAHLYLDTAIGGGPASITPAVAMVGEDHLVFGSDYPQAGVETIEETLRNLDRLGQSREKALQETFASLFPAAARRATGTSAAEWPTVPVD